MMEMQATVGKMPEVGYAEALSSCVQGRHSHMGCGCAPSAGADNDAGPAQIYLRGDSYPSTFLPNPSIALHPSQVRKLLFAMTRECQQSSESWVCTPTHLHICAIFRTYS